jgi:hypothetical protein
MKNFLLSILVFCATAIKAQKYVLLDPHLSEPVRYSNTVTSQDKFNDLFPVEKKLLPEFLKALEEIENKLSSKPPFGKIKDYEVGCVKFTGRVITIAGEERIDYVIIANCNNLRISMHLSNAKISNSNNAFFVKTWIQYINSFTK